MKISVCVGLFFISLTTLAQKPDTVAVMKEVKTMIDSTKNSPKNFASKLKNFVKIDTNQKRSIPRTILIRSLLVPGWGQATNKQYWIIPIIYTGAAGGIWAIWWNNRRYHYYKGFLQDIVDGKKTTVMIQPYKGFFVGGAFNKLEDQELGPFTKAQIEPAVKSFHRYRDLSKIGFVLGWVLQGVQANVSAHLKGFDTNDDISIKFEPTIAPTSFGIAVGVKIGMVF